MSGNSKWRWPTQSGSWTGATRYLVCSNNRHSSSLPEWVFSGENLMTPGPARTHPLTPGRVNAYAIQLILGQQQSDSSAREPGCQVSEPGQFEVKQHALSLLQDPQFRR